MTVPDVRGDVEADHSASAPIRRLHERNGARPTQRRNPLPFGFAFENELTSSAVGSAQPPDRGCWRAGLQNTTLLSPTENRGQIETGNATARGSASPAPWTGCFLCAPCHVGPWSSAGKMKFLPACHTEIEASTTLS